MLEKFEYFWLTSLFIYDNILYCIKMQTSARLDATDVINSVFLQQFLIFCGKGAFYNLYRDAIAVRYGVFRVHSTQEYRIWKRVVRNAAKRLIILKR